MNKLLISSILILVLIIGISSFTNINADTQKLKINIQAYKNGIPYNGPVNFIVWTLQEVTKASGVSGTSYDGSITLNTQRTGQNYISIQCIDLAINENYSVPQNYTLDSHPFINTICNLP